MATINKGTGRQFTGSFAMIQDSKTGQIESVPCLVTDKTEPIVNKCIGKEIYWEYNLDGLVHSFILADKADSWIVGRYEYEHDEDAILLEEYLKLDDKGEKTDADKERIDEIDLGILKDKAVECGECGRLGLKKYMVEYELYDNPWVDNSRVVHLHSRIPDALKDSSPFNHIGGCDELLTDSSWADFRYFYCEECERWVCEQNPQNGWMTQYRHLTPDDIGNDEKTCLRCFETHILEHGTDRGWFERKTMQGMFFSGDNHEVTNAGYTPDSKLVNVRVTNELSAQAVFDKALEYIDKGEQVIIGYDSMAIGGLEGYVTLFHKPVTAGK